MSKFVMPCYHTCFMIGQIMILTNHIGVRRSVVFRGLKISTFFLTNLLVLSLRMFISFFNIKHLKTPSARDHSIIVADKGRWYLQSKDLLQFWRFYFVMNFHLVLLFLWLVVLNCITELLHWSGLRVFSQ